MAEAEDWPGRGIGNQKGEGRIGGDWEQKRGEMTARTSGGGNKEGEGRRGVARVEGERHLGCQ